MKLNVNNLLKVLWPGLVLTAWSLYMFGTLFLNFTMHMIVLGYIVVLPFVAKDIIQKDSEE